MYWVAFKGYNNGKALSLGTIEQYEADGLGFHGYPTEAQAEANPNTVNNPLQQAQVNAWVFNDQGSLTTHILNNVPGGSAIQGAGTVLSDVSGFIGSLTNKNTWIRIAEFTLGALLILSGALTLAGQNGDIRNVIKTGAKVIR